MIMDYDDITYRCSSTVLTHLVVQIGGFMVQVFRFRTQQTVLYVDRTTSFVDGDQACPASAEMPPMPLAPQREEDGDGSAGDPGLSIVIVLAAVQGQACRRRMENKG